MIFRILYFAQLSEGLGVKEETLTSSSQNIIELKNELASRGPLWEKKILDASTRCAVDHVIADDTTAIENDAEIAFFPPMTGG